MKIFAFAALTFIISSASPTLAADFNAAITDQSGAPVVMPDGKSPLTLGSIASQALFASFPDEQNLDPQEKFVRGELGLQLSKGGKIDLTAEQTALVKKLIAKAFGPLVVARAWPLLDPAVH